MTCDVSLGCVFGTIELVPKFMESLDEGLCTDG